ncbi:MAG: GNAT family N-acetyltransferase [Nitrospiraceae bacterium]
MDIRYTDNMEGVDWERVSELFEQVGWGKRPAEEIQAAFRSSSYVRFAYDDRQVVGFGRTVDDGRYYALIVDLVVDPQYQRRGIGRTLLSYLERALSSYVFTTLTSAVGKEAFYLTQGWHRQTSSFIWPRTERQKRDHT